MYLGNQVLELFEETGVEKTELLISIIDKLLTKHELDIPANFDSPEPFDFPELIGKIYSEASERYTSLKKEPFILEVYEAYKILESYLEFVTEITPEDKNRVIELLSMVPGESKHYDKLEIVFSVLNDPDTYRGKVKTATEALKDYMRSCGVDPGKIMNLSIEDRGTQRGYNL
jgi:hypothetical protein